MTQIPVFRQSWTGWPEDCNDELSLLQIGMESGSVLRVNLVRKHDRGGSQEEAGPSNSSSMPIVIDDSITVDDDNNDDTDDEYHDTAEAMDDDDFFAQSDIVSRSGNELINDVIHCISIITGITPLLPDDFGDEALAGIKFGEEFGNRYGSPRPGFFPGSLDDALTEVRRDDVNHNLMQNMICLQACNKPADERKMLAIYLHHDQSVLTNVFCTQVKLLPINCLLLI